MKWRSLYSGRTLAASAPWPPTARFAIRGARRNRARTYSRYPRYPQAESAWPGRFFVTASGCGRDDLSETKESLPSHSRSGCPAGRLRAAGQAEAKGRAADEAAARRTMAGLPFSGCESGRLREAPIGTESLRARGTGQAGHRTFGSRTSPAASGISISASPPAEKGFGLDRSGRTGFRPGSCEMADPGFRSMDARRTRGFGRGSRRLRNRGLRLYGTAKAGSGTRVPNRQAANRQGFGPGRGAGG